MKISKFGYFWLDTWVLANIIQLSTQEFCQRYLNRSNDPCGRQFDQMTQAARSAPANIAEGNSRHSTSKETEMKLDATDALAAALCHFYQSDRPASKKTYHSWKEFINKNPGKVI